MIIVCSVIHLVSNVRVAPSVAEVGQHLCCAEQWLPAAVPVSLPLHSSGPNSKREFPFDDHYPVPIPPVAPTWHQCSLSGGTSLFLAMWHLYHCSDSIVRLLWYTAVTPALCYTTKTFFAHRRKSIHQHYVNAHSSCGELSYAFLCHSDSLAGLLPFCAKGD